MNKRVAPYLCRFSGLILLIAAGTLFFACSMGTANDPVGNANAPAIEPEQADTQARHTAEIRALYEKPVEQWPAAEVDEGVEFVEFGPVPEPVFPEDNPHSVAKEELGKLLFFDPRLSGSGQMACASCHDPDLAWTDGRTASFGDRRLLLKRNAPSIKNSGHWTSLFWDGRAGSLEELVLEVIQNPDELHAELPNVEAVIAKSPEYLDHFEKAFGTREVDSQLISKAVATFCRTVNSGRADLDRFMAGDHDILSDGEVRGLHLFRTQARCANCHHGPLFADNQFHNVGLSVYGQKKFEDRGRWHQTGKVEDMGAFRTPSLRNITKTGPYMHHGRFTLENVLNLYNVGMPDLKRGERFKDDPNFPIKDPLIKPLDLTPSQLADLRAFLGTLEERRRRVDPPKLPAMQ